LTTTLPRRPKTRKQRQVNDRQRRQRQRQLQGEIAAALGQIVRASIEGALQAEVTTLVGRPKNARRDRTDPTVVRALEFEHLVPYGRLWFDLEERARELAGLGVSLRDSVEVLAWLNRHQRREHGQAVLTAAAAVYQGTDEPQMRQRLGDFRVTWGGERAEGRGDLGTRL
jgi:hypothetical protein